MPSNSIDLNFVFNDEQLFNANPKTIQSRQELQLQNMLQLIARAHPIYRAQIKRQRIEVDQIKTFADLDRHFPTTSKEDFVSNPIEYVLEPDESNPKDYLNWDVTYTAGTSGVPAPVFQTAYDFKGVLFSHKRMAMLRGMSSTDTIFNMYPLAPYPHGGWIRPSQAAAVIGAAVVVGMSGSTSSNFPVLRRFEELVDLVEQSNPSVLWGVPSYVLKVLLELQRRQSKLPKLRLLNVSGEPCGPKLRDQLGAAAASLTQNRVIISDSLGATEMQFSLVQCDGGSGFHNPVPEIARLSVIDETGVEVSDGKPGKLQVTHLNRRGTVLIKYLLGDLATMDFQPCSNCGWTGGTIAQHLGREGKFLKVRGQMVNSQSIIDYLESHALVLDYKIVISNNPVTNLDEVYVNLVTPDGKLNPEDDDVINAQLSDLAGLRVTVRLAEQSEIWVPEQGMKPKRLEDQRSNN
jgi:phenylacetate-CoA ligase